MIFDPMYFLFLAPALLLGLWAQWKVKSAYAQGSRIESRQGMTGAQAAKRIMEAHGIYDVPVEQVQGWLSDHYDPSKKVLRLSPDVYHGRSLAAVGIAAHEAGHALQDAQNYALLSLRNSIVPMAATGGQLAGIFIMIGFFLMVLFKAGVGWWILLAGIGLFSLIVMFQLINLPVEFNASSRAKELLVQTGVIGEQELGPVRKVLSAAAMTYVAATLSAILSLAYYIFLALSLGGRDE